MRDADYKALQKYYEDKFHLELGNFEGGTDPSSIDLKAGTVDVKYNIYVARVAISRDHRKHPYQGRTSSGAFCARCRARFSTPTPSSAITSV